MKKIKEIAAKIDQNPVRNAKVVAVAIGILAIVALLKENKEVKEDLHVALDGYLTLANEVAIANGLTLEGFLYQYETNHFPLSERAS